LNKNARVCIHNLSDLENDCQEDMIQARVDLMVALFLCSIKCNESSTCLLSYLDNT
ncbi:hypothetical protein BgiBS90_032087, partial [Biomphalaria glabrata]